MIKWITNSRGGDKRYQRELKWHLRHRIKGKKIRKRGDQVLMFPIRLKIGGVRVSRGIFLHVSTYIIEEVYKFEKKYLQNI